MKYINYDLLNNYDIDLFRKAEYFPHANLQGFLTDEGFKKLASTFMMDKSKMVWDDSTYRGDNQGVHSRYHFYPTKENMYLLDKSWQDFFKELESDEYLTFVSKLLNIDKSRLYINYKFHLQPSGCEVPAHLDTFGKASNHLLYFNTEEDWKDEYGGHTIGLCSKNVYKVNQTISDDDFEKKIKANILGNYSFIFKNTKYSWHKVDKIDCPDNLYRKVLLISIFDKRDIQFKNLKQKIYNILPKGIVNLVRKIK